MKELGTIGWRFKWLSGIHNGLVKWWLYNIDGWKENSVKEISTDKGKFNVVITKVKEYDNYVDYEGKILGDFVNLQIIENGIGSYVKRIIIPALVALIGYLIQFTVVILWINLFGSQITKAFTTLAPVAIGSLGIYALYKYIKKK